MTPKVIAPTVQLQPKTKSAGETSYPAWFWKMPHSENSLFAVGFSETFFYPESSKQNAIKDGIESLAKYLSVRIKGERGVLRDGSRVIFSGDDIQEILSPSVLSFVEEHHQIIATYTGKKYRKTKSSGFARLLREPLREANTFVLLSMGEGNAETFPHSASAAPMPSRPSWITTPPKEPGYLYAIGNSNPYYREVNSWRIAEKRARITLAFNLESKIRGLAKKLDSSMETISTISTDVQLNRVQVIARWKHPEDNTCHVLVRVPLSVNEEAIKNLLRSALSKKDQKQELSPEELIQRAFDELEKSIGK